MTITVNQIREKFLNFFEKHDHKIVQASSLVPHNDPTMMFVNSGMVQFKNQFTGLEQPKSKRAASCQKCVRAGGKHNDLENVGYTARHHTFFEMLGNFSFGDYFKEKAIYYAFLFLTKELGIDKNRLYATIYHTDHESEILWKKISGFSDEKIIKISTNDNFWSMGDLGPCGPCSEIFYDHGKHIKGGLPGTIDQDGDRFIEIWNMVFMQYEQKPGGEKIELPMKSIDTGMGLERIAAVMQKVHNNYEIDLFREIIKSSEEATKIKSEGLAAFSHRIIADHLRSCSFLIADGIMPSNEGRGYVLRRIMRRAMRHAHQLGASDPLLHRLVPSLVGIMGDAYPELGRASKLISEILRSEEERFKLALERGIRLLDQEITHKKPGDVLDGDIAFKLYDTYGFPVDLTEDMLKEKKITIDTKRFEELMLEQKTRAKKSWSGSGESTLDEKWFDIKDKFGSTEFLGYSLNKSSGVVNAILIDGKIVDRVEKGDNCIIITNQTPFYGESGGQMGDIGEIFHSNVNAKVVDTKKYLGSIIAHIVYIESGFLKEGDNVELQFNEEYRNNLRKHHSATHLLHKVLRDELGTHITQKGSLVSHDKLRFDISHPKQISSDELSSIEQKINKIILANEEVSTKLMNIDDAIKGGAMAIFGEKYDSEVLVVSMGNNHDKSVELCGGTHVKRLGEIGLFKIISEGAIASGIRRIEAVCGMAALDYLNNQMEMLDNISEALKSPKKDLVVSVTALANAKKHLEQELQNLKAEKALITNEEIKEFGKQSGAVRVYIKTEKNIDIKSHRIAAEKVISSNPDLILVYIAEEKQKISIVTACGDQVKKNCNALNLIKLIAESYGIASGGGNEKIAQTGGDAKNVQTKEDLYQLIIAHIIGDIVF